MHTQPEIQAVSKPSDAAAEKTAMKDAASERNTEIGAVVPAAY